MDNLTHPEPAFPPTEPDELVCSPEFTGGCADPEKGMPPKLAPGAPIPEVRSRPEPAARSDADDAPEPVLTHNAEEEPEPGFPEVACSAEFPEGCVDQSGEAP